MFTQLNSGLMNVFVLSLCVLRAALCCHTRLILHVVLFYSNFRPHSNLLFDNPPTPHSQLTVLWGSVYSLYIMLAQTVLCTYVCMAWHVASNSRRRTVMIKLFNEQCSWTWRIQKKRTTMVIMIMVDIKTNTKCHGHNLSCCPLGYYSGNDDHGLHQQYHVAFLDTIR